MPLSAYVPVRSISTDSSFPCTASQISLDEATLQCVNVSTVFCFPSTSQCEMEWLQNVTGRKVISQIRKFSHASPLSWSNDCFQEQAPQLWHRFLEYSLLTIPSLSCLEVGWGEKVTRPIRCPPEVNWGANFPKAVSNHDKEFSWNRT